MLPVLCSIDLFQKLVEPSENFHRELLGRWQLITFAAGAHQKAVNEYAASTFVFGLLQGEENRGVLGPAQVDPPLFPV